MSGHSKWATTKRHKAAIDAKRGKLFSTLSKDISLAARDGGGDVNFNARLRLIVQKAKEANMPADNIKKAIQKGTGEVPGASIEELTYEGYAPGGVGLIIEVTTDNKNRAASDIRSTLTKCGGNLTSPGALMFNFQRMGQFFIPKDAVAEDNLMEIALNAGAEDIKTDDDGFEVLCPIAAYYTLAHAIAAAGIECLSSELAYVPNSLVKIADADVAAKVLKTVDRLEDLDDVKMVFSNFDIGDDIDTAAV
ncbi:MAG: YebC/PmpR family DNA-binding transcriptional regulator [Puniceicoccales bacterium]|jgi:YebC/PmpR family DNA-binding regulatory protein|nr:YebC/PmpR family DNA-binding transcriptional regulator [Puniceicoccales bacterium]